MIKEAINMLVGGMNLSLSEMTDCMNEIMEGKATDAQIGAFLTAMRYKGETVAEITAAAQVMREKATTTAAECTATAEPNPTLAKTGAISRATLGSPTKPRPMLARVIPS